MQNCPTISRERALFEGIPPNRLYACAFSNAEVAGNAYREGDYDTAIRLWRQADRLVRTADELKALELSRAA